MYIKCIWYIKVHIQFVCKCIHYKVYNDLTAQGPCRGYIMAYISPFVPPDM